MWNILKVWILKSQKKKETQPIMYLIPKKYKIQTGAHFFIASKICSTKQVSKSISHVFKLEYSKIENSDKSEILIKL